MQDMPAADGVTCHQGNDRLGHAADQPLQLQDIQPRHAVLADVSALLLATDLLVAP